MKTATLLDKRIIVAALHNQRTELTIFTALRRVGMLQSMRRGKAVIGQTYKFVVSG